MQQRLGGKKARVTILPEVSRPGFRAANQIILGIDPSVRGTGYGVIRVEKNNLSALAQGQIVSKAWASLKHPAAR